MEELRSQVVIHQSGRFLDSYQMSKKRSLPVHPSSFARPNNPDNWNPQSWNWDSSRFVAKPSDQCDQVQNINENLGLKLGGGDVNGNGGGLSLVGPQPVSRPNKRVRSGSPGCTANYPMCQVDDCEEDLSRAKDYHRRHKVCEAHSKAGKASVGKQMQRFCQQCSRFHHLSEFDEGKRSCRRRLAGHNRRRRKTQPDETSPPRSLAPGSRDNNVTNNDIINLLTVLSCAQGNNEGAGDKLTSIPSKDQLIQILSKINSLPLPENTNTSVPSLTSSENPKPKNVNVNASLPSTMDFLGVLSKSNNMPFPDTSENHSESSDSEKCKSPFVDRDTSPNLPLQLFSPSPEDYRSMKLTSSGSSNNPSPMSSPPVVHDLFPMRASREMKDARFSSNSGEIGYMKSGVSNGCSTSLQLFGSSIQVNENGSNQSSPYRTGYASDHSASSLDSDAQDRTGRIIFKLFDKDPSHLPGSLRTQINNWLSNSPSEMESYIRPGCIVLSVYLSMPSCVWEQLEKNIINHVKSLVKDIDVDFWGSGRFLVHTDRQMVSYKEGNIRLCKSLRAWTIPELISVSPVAVVAGQKTSLSLRGRNLSAPETMIHCTHAAGYNYSTNEIPLSSCQDSSYDQITLNGFRVNRTETNIIGRFFIEVENKSRTTSFPVIIADTTICQELRLLEPEINSTTEACESIKHFLNELGWLFQRKHNSFLFGTPDYKLTRFKFLLIFSTEHDFCALVKTLLDILVELNVVREELVKESLDMLSEIHLLNRAVKRRSWKMIDMLVNYSIINPNDNSENFIFVPDMAGPGGFTPLHLAACTSASDDLVDALTNDPKEVGMHSWNSVLDANGLSPYAYALMRNNHSYNALVARKLADKKNGQISVPINDEIEHFQVEMDADKTSISELNKRPKSCSRCAAIVKHGYSKNFTRGSKGFLQRPYIHSMLVVAAVCVCVCLLIRGHPHVGCGSPFAWENLGYGAV
ncbi:SBP domain [Castilleja foliolosa]|uniref:SBP domain n=1 Tax=Castilleja foliolosa TaxID=1961234 RepID=A0ABD3BLT2_9LAMI